MYSDNEYTLNKIFSNYSNDDKNKYFPSKVKIDTY